MPDIRIIPMDTPGWYVVRNGQHTASVRLHNKPTHYGILGGQIIKLSIQDGEGEEVLNYDRGFDFDHLDQSGREFMAAVVNRMNWSPSLPFVAEIIGWSVLGSVLVSLVMIALYEWRKCRRPDGHQ